MSFRRPAIRLTTRRCALVLGRQKPDELVEKTRYLGLAAKRRYAQIRFGSPSSTRVTIVIDELNNGEVDLYVDADRNLRIDDRDRVSAAPGLDGPAPSQAGTPLAETDVSSARRGPRPREPRMWRTAMGVALVENETVRIIPRAVVFRLGASGQTLGFATAGYLEGRVVVRITGDDGQHRSRVLAARRVDGDGNGFLADGQDHLLIDWDGDGRFNPGAEHFLFATVLNLQGSRYIVRSDELGSRLAIDPLEGTGTVRLAMLNRNVPAAGVKATEMRATAIGRDGSVFALTGNEPAIVPAGEYRLGNLTISLDDAKSGEMWSFVFSDGLWSKPGRWYKVDKDAAVTIDPIGTPRLELRRFDPNAVARSGDDVSVRPALYTGDGLLIIVAYRGRPLSPATQELLGARIGLMNADGETLATAQSGFS